jgi:hypothetical protein
MDDVVATIANNRAQPQQSAELLVAPHAEVANGHTAGPDLVGDRTGVVQGNDVRFVSGTTHQHRKLLLGATRIKAGDDLENLHPRLPFSRM